MEEFVSTITLPLKKYESLLKERDELSELVKQKEIVKYAHPTYYYIITAIGISVAVFIFLLMTNK